MAMTEAEKAVHWFERAREIAAQCDRYREALEQIRDGIFSGNQAAAWARNALDPSSDPSSSKEHAMPIDPYNAVPPEDALVGPTLPTTAKRVTQWHKQDRCWRCGSFKHYEEACPEPKVFPDSPRAPERR